MGAPPANPVTPWQAFWVLVGLLLLGALILGLTIRWVPHMAGQ